MTFIQVGSKWQLYRCILSMQHCAAVCGCIGARLLGMPLRGIDRLYALTGSTLRVYLHFDNTGRVRSSVCLYMLYIQAYPSRLLRTGEPLILSASCFLHSKKIQNSCIFLTSVWEGGLFSKPVNLTGLFCAEINLPNLLQLYFRCLQFNQPKAVSTPQW